MVIHLTLAYQGEPGCNTEKAAQLYFDRERRLGRTEVSLQGVPRRSFSEVFASVDGQGTSVMGLVPMENTLTGSIHENFDLLLRHSSLKILGEVKLRIVHSLIGLPHGKIEDIEQVYSHPQGLLQCKEFLDAHSQWEGISHYDTAGAVAMVKKLQDTSKAAIAGDFAAELYGMKVFAKGIETNHSNFTRFFLIGREEDAWGQRNKASLVFSLPDKPGALVQVLQVFVDHDCNLHKLESRPIHGKPWEYMFYADVQLIDEARFETACSKLIEVCPIFRELGRYEAHEEAFT